MPKVIAQGKEIECNLGDNLRRVLLQNGIAPHNDNAKVINCRGIGTCGTCAVKIEGDLSPPNWRETARMQLPPHSPERGLRLACQIQVISDVRVTKFNKFWGHGYKIIWTPFD
ncbi:MAG: 2Fe-2S iron-sulfur cluster-binding protein [Cyanobacteria bacterium P01_A01_bin.45]